MSGQIGWDKAAYSSVVYIIEYPLNGLYFFHAQTYVYHFYIKRCTIGLCQ